MDTKTLKNNKLKTLHRPPVALKVKIPGVILFIFLNLLMSKVNNDVLRSPVFLDSIFTAGAAVLYGPFMGVMTGLFTNLLMEPMYGMGGYHWPFALCNMLTGLIVGYMNKKDYFSNSLHLSLTIIAVTLANAIPGSLIAYFVYGGNTNVGLDYIVNAFTSTGRSLLTSTFWARIPTNLIDKMLVVYAAFGIKRFVHGTPE